MDGQPLPEGTRLEARIRDYVTWTFVLQDGNYRSLLVGPPNRDYYLGTVTFHALGVTAQEQDVFRPAGAPVFAPEAARPAPMTWRRNACSSPTSAAA